MYTKNIKKQCGKRTFNSINCHNKIRKTAQNRFERVFLCGKYAFKYSVIIENLTDNKLTEYTFPTRKEALCFFMLTSKRY